MNQKIKKNILQSRLNDIKLKAAVEANKQSKKMQSKWFVLKIYLMFFLKIVWELVLESKIINLMFYGLTVTLFLTLLKFPLNWFQFVVGIAVYVLYSKIVNDIKRKQ